MKDLFTFLAPYKEKWRQVLCSVFSYINQLADKQS